MIELWILFSIIWIIVCTCVASRKNRSVFGWFLLGLFFGLFAAIAILCLPALKEKVTKTDVERMLLDKYPPREKDRT